MTFSFSSGGRLSPAGRAAYLGVTAAAAFGLSYLELLIPMPMLPGARLGLANIAVLTAIYLGGPRDGVIILISRLLTAFLVFGSVTSLIYSLAGGCLSLAGMLIAMRTKRLSPIGVSIIGGALHNTGQVIAAAVLMGRGAFGYYPMLLALGAFSGAVTGSMAAGVLKVLRGKKD